MDGEIPSDLAGGALPCRPSMWRLTRPDAAAVATHRDQQRALRFTYPGVGSTRDDQAAPPGFDYDHTRAVLGAGADAFAAACAAIRGWQMFPPP